MNKTIIISIGILTTGITLIFCMYIFSYFSYQYLSKIETRDRVTVCIDTIMTKSIEAKKPIDAKVAKEICG